MPDQMLVNPAALEPLFSPWEEPTKHRIRGDKPGEPAKIINGRRPSPIVIAQNLRWSVKEWRETPYAGASDTTRALLNHWFNRSHRGQTPAGEEFPFHYYFCQREAIETLIYLREVRGLTSLSDIVANFGGHDAEIQALGITEEEDMWPRYAFKVATGAGKTKIMSLAMVWSYFHHLRESDSPLTRRFVVVAPNLTVYERLKEDFGDGRIFDTDPLIPAEWRGDWNLSIVLQDEATGAATGGTLYLTNIHRLYDQEKRRKNKDGETYEWAGPSVSKAKALDTGAALRDRITSHPGVLVFNDEAYHVWDPDSAWSTAIRYLHDTLLSRTGRGLVAQLDFSATPKDDRAQPFKHIVCDTPLGEAVDAGIVKTPIIGRTEALALQPADNAADKYDRHLRLGYERWRLSKQEWEKSGKKALMFVMCEDTGAADQIATRLNMDDAFRELNGKTINLHTNLKGRVRYSGTGANRIAYFQEAPEGSGKGNITDEDLKILRDLSRKLDDNSSPYNCIVSVLMLREGWDVRNVTTIVPLRPYSSKAEILPEQTLGRGLRRITPPGGANEIVTVVDHPSFASLYQQELAQEGLPIEIIDVEQVPKTTVSIYPDEARKDVKALEILLPRLSSGHRIVPTVEGITLEEARQAFKPYKPLPLAKEVKTEIDYEGRQRR
jgi:type III restriction enzyme